MTLSGSSVIPSRKLVFVCTGNICRSPMAEGLMTARLGPLSPWRVASAGIGAFPGIPASAPAVTAMRERGVDIRAHRSRPLTRGEVDGSSLVVVMTEAHRRQVLALFPGSGEKTFLLRSFDPRARGGDVEDPIGSSVETYRQIRDQIEAALPELESFMKSLQIR